MGQAADDRQEAYERFIQVYVEETGFSEEFIQEYLVDYSNIDGTEIVQEPEVYSVEKPYYVQEVNADGTDLENLIMDITDFPYLKKITTEKIDLAMVATLTESGYKGNLVADIITVEITEDVLDHIGILNKIEFDQIYLLEMKNLITTIVDNQINVSPVGTIDVESLCNYIEQYIIQTKKTEKNALVFKEQWPDANLPQVIFNIIDCLMLKNSIKISALTIQNTSIEQLMLKEHKNLQNITYLDLCDNQLKTIEHLLLSLPNLEHLICTGNKFNKFQEIKSSKLKTLAISYADSMKETINYANLTELNTVSIHGSGIKTIELSPKCELTYLNISNTDVEKIKLNELPDNYIFDHTPLVNNDYYIKRIMESKISFSCIPRIIFEIENGEEHNLPDFAFIKNKQIKRNEYIHISRKIINSLKFSNALHSEYSININQKNNTERYSWVAIDGKWGNGKSYFFKNYITPDLEKNNFEIINISSVSLLTSNIYMSILEELGYKENSFDGIKRIININKEMIDITIKVYKLFCLLLVALFLWNINRLKANSSDLINYISVMVSAFLLPSIYFLTESFSKQNQIQKAEQKNVDDFLDNFNCDKNKVLVIDDIERCKVEQQMELLNVLTKLNEKLHIILVADLTEVKNSISNNYGESTDYNAYISKYIDSTIDFDSDLKASKFEYFSEKYHFIDENTTRNIAKIIDFSEVMQSLSIRELDQVMQGVMSSFEDDNPFLEKNEKIYKAIIGEIAKRSNITDNVFEVDTYFNMYQHFTISTKNSVDRYSLYSFDEMLVYMSLNHKLETNQVLTNLQTGEFIAGDVFESIEKEKTILNKYVNEFVERYSGSEFELIMWEKILNNEYNRIENKSSLSLEPNRAAIATYIKKMNGN